MKRISEEDKNEIEIGDMVLDRETGKYFLVAYDNRTSEYDISRFLILDLINFNIVNSFKEIKHIKDSYELALKNEDLLMLNNKLWAKYSKVDYFINYSRKFKKMDKEEQERLKLQRIALHDCILDLYDFVHATDSDDNNV